jgi:hypothetical protein
MITAVSGKRLTAAGVVLAMLCVVAAASGRPTPQRGHTCSATDRQFIQVAQLNMASLGSWSEDYVNGDAKGSDVIAEAHRATKRVGATSPSDPSLTQTRALMLAMFSEYARAINAKEHHKESGNYIFRAYGLANFAHDVLVEAKPALLARGCNVEPLL